MTGSLLLLYLSKEVILNYSCVFIQYLMQNEHFPFIYCVESLVYHKNYTQWETCFEKLNLKKKPVTDCVVSGRGKEVSSLIDLELIINHVLSVCLSGFCFSGVIEHFVVNWYYF